ncbi:tRNA guanosine(34) transglycosylase Tgt [Candidatus Saccharibacteria bacterium]|nr:tRNA guanosine(34) transglycosylase Tgt [Candidatus Saccharibacteria bacterium]
MLAPQLKFDIEKQTGLMRAGVIHTPHGDIQTPAFVGAATRATVKALTHAQMRELGSQAILANTYHLILAPGPALIAQAGGLAAFTGWNGPTFTDSGGFQMLSLTDAKIDHDGVTFKSHINGDKIRMNPEISMQAQWQIGADIHMAFDQAIDSTDKNLVRQAMERTHNWLPRNIREHQHLAAAAQAAGQPAQFLYAVVQGGLFEDLRRQSAELMAAQPVDGFGIGSLYTTETEATANIIKLTNEILPQDKPRHLLGMGSEPRDLFIGAQYGCDTFDCVAPTRQARNGALYTPNGRVNIKNARFRHQFTPVDPDCDCYLCQYFTAAYLHHLFKVDEITGKTLASIHNERFVVRTTDRIRASILNDSFEDYKSAFLAQYYAN